MKPKQDKRKSALFRLFDDEQQEENVRPFNKGASGPGVDLFNLKSERQRGPDQRVLLDSVISKTELLHQDHQSSGIFDILPSDKAKSIPLIFESDKVL